MVVVGRSIVVVDVVDVEAEAGIKVLCYCSCFEMSFGTSLGGLKAPEVVHDLGKDWKVRYV